MRKKLPVFILSLIFALQLCISSAFAQAATPTPTTAQSGPTATPTPDQTGTHLGTTNPSTTDCTTISVNGVVQPPPNDKWCPDAEVTFVGKTAARAGEFLNWALANYNWVNINNQGNSLVDFWVTIRNIVGAFLVLFVLVAAFVMMITRGRSVTLSRFVLRFIAIALFVTFSFSLVQFIYQIGDIIQGFFLSNPAYASCVQAHQTAQQTCLKYISSQNLLNIAFPYKGFHGLIRTGPDNAESAFVSLLLVKATAITYYVMVGVLTIRKIILWFFIILSPVFPLLLFFSPLRNTAKIWVGEFFRWLLYAPLFAIFLGGLVRIWGSPGGVPLNFKFDNVGQVVYPTAVNILLGGPGQTIFYKDEFTSNSINLRDTFALYVISLIMLWVVIILPFILLKIFLDYFRNFSFSDSSFVKQLIAGGTSWMSRPQAPNAPTPLPSSPASSGVARPLPSFSGKFAIPQTRKIEEQTNIRNVTDVSRIKTNEVTSEILKLTNLSVPTMQDIARFETTTLSKDTVDRSRITTASQTLEKIANPMVVQAPSERVQFTSIKEKLVKEKQSGNPLASAILSASVSASSVGAREQKAGVAPGGPSVAFPVVNRVQSVNIDDYESVKKMWKENYQKLDVPQAVGQKEKSRKEWASQDINTITKAINLLSSPIAEKNKEGMDMVSNILPFLLIGGFSKTEVIAYLRAKEEAAKEELSEADKKQEEEETMVTTDKKQEEKPKEMTAEAVVEKEEADEKEKKNPSQEAV